MIYNCVKWNCDIEMHDTAWEIQTMSTHQPWLCCLMLWTETFTQCDNNFNCSLLGNNIILHSYFILFMKCQNQLSSNITSSTTDLSCCFHFVPHKLRPEVGRVVDYSQVWILPGRVLMVCQWARHFIHVIGVGHRGSGRQSWHCAPGQLWL